MLYIYIEIELCCLWCVRIFGIGLVPLASKSEGFILGRCISTLTQYRWETRLCLDGSCCMHVADFYGILFQCSWPLAIMPSIFPARVSTNKVIFLPRGNNRSSKTSPWRCFNPLEQWLVPLTFCTIDLQMLNDRCQNPKMIKCDLYTFVMHGHILQKPFPRICEIIDPLTHWPIDHQHQPILVNGHQEPQLISGSPAGMQDTPLA